MTNHPHTALEAKNENYHNLHFTPDEDVVSSAEVVDASEVVDNFDVDAPRTDPTPEEITRHKEYDRKLKEEYQQRIKTHPYNQR